VIRFIVAQYRHGCRVGFNRRAALARAVRIYKQGF
jgi:hypothetical protein